MNDQLVAAVAGACIVIFGSAIGTLVKLMANHNTRITVLEETSKDQKRSNDRLEQKVDHLADTAQGTRQAVDQLIGRLDARVK